MKKNTKGFTLIELLAVIVILAIIALIATPIVLNLIGKARLGAAKDSAYGVKKAAELYYAEALITSPTSFAETEFTCDGKSCKSATGETLEIDGTVPEADTKITISEEGKVSFADLKINGYSLTFNEETKVFEERS